jgi:N-acetylglucosamine kinase-like BadF-type ATPase
MKPRTIARLDLLAATSEAQIRNDISRLTAALAQMAEQRSVLAIYGARLTKSWREGGVVLAGTAQLAGHFAVASQNARTQIGEMELQITTQLAAAWQTLAAIQERRRSLDESARHTLLEAQAEVERRHERELTSHYLGKSGRSG